MQQGREEDTEHNNWQLTMWMISCITVSKNGSPAAEVEYGSQGDQAASGQESALWINGVQAGTGSDNTERYVRGAWL